MDTPVQLVFFGEVLDGYLLHEVKRRVGLLLTLDEARLARMFSGQRTVLKRSMAQTDAQRYARVLAQAGARIHIEPSAVAAAAAPAWSAAAGFPAIDPRVMDAPAQVAAPTRHPMAAAAALVPTAPPALVAPPSAAPSAASAASTTPAPQRQSIELSLAAPAEEEITCPTCGERQSKRLLCRSCATDMAMGIAAKLEAENEARHAKNDALLARRAMQASRPIVDRSPGAFGLGLTGRMGRLKYATSNLWMLTVLYLLAVLVLQKPSIGRVAFGLMGLALVGAMSLRLSVLRCHDCNKSGWWSMLTFIPSVNAVFSLVLSFAPGTQGDNDYGDESPRSSWGFFWLAAACLILAFSLTIKSTIRMAERSAGEHDEETSDVVEFDTRSNSLPSGAAREAFNGPYATATGHKAFAVSSAGAWGMSSGAGSITAALQAAVSDCEVRRESYSPRCVPVNLDGNWGPSK